MKGKIVSVLVVLVMLINMAVWAEDENEDEGNPVVVITTVTLIVLLGILITVWAVDGISEADTPDDGIRLASLQGKQSGTEMNTNPVLKLLQRIEVGQRQNNDMYVGLRFRY